MDPEATLSRADQAVSDCDIEEAREALNDYWSWRRCGGYEPRHRASATAGDEFARRIAQRIESQEAQS